MKKLITGADAAAEAIRLSDPKVIAAYPITPQTHIIEKLAQFVSEGRLKARYICTDSELSSIGIAAGAVIEGVRAFTATASHGLVFMHEALHWIAGGRLPVVMVVATRGIGAPWILMSDMQDALSQRDTGWMMLFASTAQEVHDFIPLAYRVAEAVMIPCMVCMDGFLISHTAEPVELLSEEDVREFLPPFESPLAFGDDPFTLWPIPDPDTYYTIRQQLFEDHKRAIDVWNNAFSEFSKVTGRDYSICESYMLEDAECAFVAMGAASCTTKEAVNILRRQGEKAGLLKINLFRPFPEMEVLKHLSHVDLVLPIDRAVSYGKMGILGQEIRSCIFHAKVVNFIGSLGGKDLTPERIIAFYKKATSCGGDVLWM